MVSIVFDQNALGARLKRIRRRAKLSQRAVAKRAGLGHATVSDIESGTHVGAGSASRVADALGYDLLVETRYRLRRKDGAP